MRENTTNPDLNPQFDHIVIPASNLDVLTNMGREAGLKLLSKHEQAGTLYDYVKEVAPNYICGSEVHKFRLIEALGW
ncbi:hypothetical protein [Neptuniibacter sp. QD37_11]|uniref:hypothetical protein n=1 Tax=Neptuniibacter sp. QD37_11 TaxID=3398209 RepID=UPI0039F614D6